MIKLVPQHRLCRSLAAVVLPPNVNITYMLLRIRERPPIDIDAVQLDMRSRPRKAAAPGWSGHPQGCLPYQLAGLRRSVRPCRLAAGET